MGANWLNAVGWVLIGLMILVMVTAILDGKGNYMEEIIVAILITIWVISYAIRNR